MKDRSASSWEDDTGWDEPVDEQAQRARDEARRRLVERVEEARRLLGARTDDVLRQLGTMHAAEVSQDLEEREARMHFESLKSKYHAGDYFDTSPSSPLYAALVKLESDQPLALWETQWLEREDLFGPLAFNSEGSYWNGASTWSAVEACKYWSSLGKPQEALRLSAIVLNQPDFAWLSDRERSAIFTTRGRAFRTMGELHDAEQCGLAAIDEDAESFHPHNLLGAICYQSGRPSRGDEYFAEAERLGAPQRELEASIRNAVRLAEPEARRLAAEYLLAKDGIRFRWANAYVQS